MAQTMIADLLKLVKALTNLRSAQVTGYVEASEKWDQWSDSLFLSPAIISHCCAML
jgi:hypothetical protein